MLDLIGNYLSQQEATKLIVTTANQLVNKLSNETKILSKRSMLEARRCKRAVPTRWFSTLVMLEYLREVRQYAISIYDNLDRFSEEEYASLIDEQDFWPD